MFDTNNVFWILIGSYVSYLLTKNILLFETLWYWLIHLKCHTRLKFMYNCIYSWIRFIIKVQMWLLLTECCKSGDIISVQRGQLWWRFKLHANNLFRFVCLFYNEYFLACKNINLSSNGMPSGYMYIIVSSFCHILFLVQCLLKQIPDFFTTISEYLYSQNKSNVCSLQTFV